MGTIAIRGDSVDYGMRMADKAVDGVKEEVIWCRKHVVHGVLFYRVKTNAT